MPFEIQPIGNTPTPLPTSIGDSARWIDQQQFHPDLANRNADTHAIGTFLGGPSQQQLQVAADPLKYAIAAHAPPNLTPAATAGKQFGKFGNITIDMIDPSMTMQSFATGAGATNEQAASFVNNPLGFLASKDINPFSAGSQGAPARLFDYGTNWVGAIFDQITGKPMPKQPTSGDSVIKYNFQNDQGYWDLLRQPNMTDAQLQAIAANAASRYGDNASYLTGQLFDQMKADRKVALGLSSGREDTDYLAKLAFTTDYISARTGGDRQITGTTIGRNGVPIQYSFKAPSEAANAAALAVWPAAVVAALPGSIDDIRQLVSMTTFGRAGIYEHPKQIEDAWAQLTPEQRQKYYGDVGIPETIGSLAIWIPALGGLGAVEAVAARSTVGAFRAAANIYNATLKVTGAVMATGVGVATVNWIAEAAVPGYAEGLGKRIDYARPFSGSAVAGAINQIGFFASGTFGVNLAARTALRYGGKAIEAVPGVGRSITELAYFKVPYGGVAHMQELAATGLPDPGLLELAPKQSFVSQLTNLLEERRRDGWAAALRGEPTGTPFDALSHEEKIAVINEDLLRGLEQGGAEVEMHAKVMLEARRDRPLTGGEAQQLHDLAVRDARHIDDALANRTIRQYGPEWLARLAGSTSVQDLEAYARATVTRLGGDGTKLGKHNDEGWGQMIRSLHNYEYAKQASTLHHAAEGSAEAAKIMLVQADHLFANEVDRSLAVLRGDDAVLAQQAAADLIRTKQEAAQWYAHEWKPAEGVVKSPEGVPPAELADWLDQVREGLPSRRAVVDPASPAASEPLNAFHVQLEKDGLWTLGFKPVDEAGNAISYVRGKDGSVFKSPWIEYPVGSQAAIELGNRGLLLSKMDGIFRGFRTWRITEYQRASMFRRLSSTIDVSPEQINQFFSGVLKLARKHEVQPQTIGAVGKARLSIPGTATFRLDIDKLAAHVFGPEIRLKTGGVATINWADEIAKSFQQSLKLNLTAGLTSHLKANLGEAGAALAWGSDIAYVAWRFNLSPLFKGGEIVESVQLNAMRGVRNVDDSVLALYHRAGVGNDFSNIVQEGGVDQLITSIAGHGEMVGSASARAAGAMGFQARHLPEDFALQASTVKTQTDASIYKALHGGGGELPTSGMLPTPNPSKVVTPDTIPPEFSSVLAETHPALVDPDLPVADQSFWHTTTNMSGVFEHGLLAGKEIPSSVVEPLLPKLNEGFNEWRARLDAHPGKLPPDLAGQLTVNVNGRTPVYRAMTDTEYELGMKAGGFGDPQGFDTRIALTRDPNALRGAKDGYIVEFDYAPTKLQVGKGFGVKRTLTTDYLGKSNRDRVWRWDPVKGDNVLIFERPGATRAVGLGGGSGNVVSVTSNAEHGAVIAERLTFASQAARNEVSSAQIVDHFAGWYDDDWGALGHSLDSHIAFNSREDVINFLNDPANVHHTAEGKYYAVVKLDTGLQRYSRNVGREGFDGSVILVGSAQEAARWRPENIGTVRLAVRRGAPAGRGVDQFESTFNSKDLLVVDDRTPLPPLADTEEELMKQLHETLAKEPKAGQMNFIDALVGGNGIAPGLEPRARQIIVKLEDINQAKVGAGPTFEWLNTPINEQAAFRSRLAEDGWHPADQGLGGSTTWVDPGPKPDHYLMGDAGAAYAAMSEADQKAASIAYYNAREAWGAQLGRGVALGKIDAQAAYDKGWIEVNRPEDVLPLPDVLYHATNDLPGVEASGLKSRQELGPDVKVNLGGGSSQTVSFTTDPATAQRIVDTTNEAGRLLRGTITVDDLLDVARAGGFEANAKKVGGGLGDAGWQRIYVRQMKLDFSSGLPRSEADQIAHSGNLGWRPTPDAVEFGYGKAGQPSWSHWERPMTQDEIDQSLLDFYKTFLAFQEHATGLLDPLYFGTDARVLKSLAPINVGVVEAHPVPGAMGRQMNSLGEWRTWSGDAVVVKRYDPGGPIYDLNGRLIISTKARPAPTPVDPNLFSRRRLDGTTETQPIHDLYNHSQRVEGAAVDLAHVAGTPEALFDNLLPNHAAEMAAKGGKDASAWDTFAHPAAMKLAQATKLQVDLMRREFPTLLRLSGNEGVAQVFRSLKLAPNRWSDFLIEDRKLLDKWLGSRSQADLDALIGHAGTETNRAAFDAMYASEDWAALSTLWATHLEVTSQEAFGVHFFAAYRSAFERSINHPLLGIYPASWTIKVAKEWARFLYDNQTLGIHLGMAPAQAIAQLSHQQQAAFAQGDPSAIDAFSQSGPLGSAGFIFNLLLPGDWSALPFPASRAIRSIARPILQGGKMPSPADVLSDQIKYMGFTRDVRLMSESIGQVGNLFTGPPKPKTPVSRKKPYSVTGVDATLSLDGGVR